MNNFYNGQNKAKWTYNIDMYLTVCEQMLPIYP